jgi:hypothetical protein
MESSIENIPVVILKEFHITVAFFSFYVSS